MISNVIIYVMLVCAFFTVFHIINALIFIKRDKVTPVFLEEKKNISVLIPCYNEEMILDSTIQGIERMSKQYPKAEFIFINDGSEDNTLSVLEQSFELMPYTKELAGELQYEEVLGTYRSTRMNNVYVIDKINGGKAHALNAGIEFCHHDLIITTDADTIFEKDALEVVNAEFEDENIIAGNGMVNILQSGLLTNNGVLDLTQDYIVRVQIMEYLKGFLVAKSSLSRMNALFIISGAFGVFRKHILMEVGGYRNVIGEDMDMTLKIRGIINENKHLKIKFLPNAICYTECPSSWRDLLNQRVRWQKGFMDSVLRYAKTLTTSFFTNVAALFILVESFLIGTCSSALAIPCIVFAAFKKDSRTFTTIIFCLILLSILNVINSVVSMYISKQYGLELERKKEFVKTLISELFFFRYIYMVFIMLGTVLYFRNKEEWNKIARTGNDYFAGEM